MVSNPADDFTDFLDFGDLNFPNFDGIPQDDAELQQQNGAGQMDTSMDASAGILVLENGSIHQRMGQQSVAPSMNGFHASTESFTDLAMQSDFFDQHQRQQSQIQNQQYHSHPAVPPTPNSMEMHGGHSQYYRDPTDLQQLNLYNQYRRHHQKDQV